MKKKIFAFTLVLFLCFSLFAQADPEQQSELLNSLPQLIKNAKLTTSSYPSVITTSTENTEPVRGFAEENLISTQMNNLGILYKYIEANFLYDIDYDKVYEKMASALFEALDDQYSVFVPIEEEDDYELSMRRQYAGAGFVLSKYKEEYQDPENIETLYCLLSQVYPNTPASKAGLKSGDYITHIDGESVINLSSEDCSSKIKGDVGTKVILTILRGEKSFDVEIVRAIVTIPELYYCMLDNGIGYLYILQFIEGTDELVKKAILDLEQQGMKNLIIDLRDNPGGLVQPTLQIADMFLTGGKVLMTTQYIAKKTISWSSSSLLVGDNIKIAILVNEGSASSSEIFASALRDNGRAILIGKTTFGKGIAQTPGIWGENEFKITTGTFVTPNGEVIQKVGLAPDIEVEDTYVLDEEVDAYIELMNSGEIKKWVDEHPDFTRANIEAFAAEHDLPLRELLLNILVRNEYVDRMDADDAPIADPWYDVQLVRAIEYLQDKK